MDFLTLIGITFAFILLSGFFSLFISALESCKKTRLEKEQSKRYKAVLLILDNPHTIIVSCRLWINILRLVAAFSAALCTVYLSAGLGFDPLQYSVLVFIIIVIIYAFFFGIIITLLGDGIPALLSRMKPEKTAASLLPLINIFSFLLTPLILPALKLSAFFNTALKTEIDDSITEDELRDALIEGEKSGIVESRERDMVEGVFYLGDRPVGAFMTHRSEIQWFDINTPYDEVREKAVEHREQRCFPVVNAGPDEIAGAVFLDDILIDTAKPSPQGLRAIMKKAVFVPETMPAIKSFESFKHGQSGFLFVMDEYGGLAGIISITALLEEIVGELSVPEVNEEPLIQQEDGSWLADGTLNIDEAAQALGLTGISEDGGFHTLAGFILNLSGEVPHVGESFEYNGYKFKVVDKDGNRIDKLLIEKIEEQKE